MRSQGHVFSPWFSHIKAAICKLLTLFFFFTFFKHTLPFFRLFSPLSVGLKRSVCLCMGFLRVSLGIYVCILVLFPFFLFFFFLYLPLNSPSSSPSDSPHYSFSNSLFLPFLSSPVIQFLFPHTSFPFVNFFWPSVFEARWVCRGSERFWEPLWLFSLLSVCLCVCVFARARPVTVVRSGLPFQWMWVEVWCQCRSTTTGGSQTQTSTCQLFIQQCYSLSLHFVDLPCCICVAIFQILEQHSVYIRSGGHWNECSIR